MTPNAGRSSDSPVRRWAVPDGALVALRRNSKAGSCLRAHNEIVIHDWVLFNDRIVPSDAASLRPGQVGLFTGWGVFTTMRIYSGVPFAIEWHWERLERDSALLHVEMPPSRDELTARLAELVDRNGRPDCKMRLNIMRSQGGLFEGPGTGRATDVIAFTRDLTEPGPSASLDLRENGRHADSPFAGTKTLSWAHNLSLFETARKAGFDDALLLNERAEVAECTSANVFAVLDGTTYTPPLTSGPLPGVTRRVMLEQLDDTVQERVLYPDDLYRAEEVFITSSTRELVPVSRISNRNLQATGWPVMKRLQDKLRAYVDDYVNSVSRR